MQTGHSKPQCNETRSDRCTQQQYSLQKQKCRCVLCASSTNTQYITHRTVAKSCYLAAHWIGWIGKTQGSDMGYNSCPPESTGTLWAHTAGVPDNDSSCRCCSSAAGSLTTNRVAVLAAWALKPSTIERQQAATAANRHGTANADSAGSVLCELAYSHSTSTHTSAE